MTMDLVDSSFPSIDGTYCYCSPSGASYIRGKIASMPLEAIHLLGTGDYHYITLFWLERVREPFSLLLFDHHPDDQDAAFGGDMISCGNWVQQAEMLPSIREINWYCEAADIHRYTIPDDLPVYVSVDLDVLSTHYARTDWSQGEMTLDSLLGLLKTVNRTYRVIGADICGGIANPEEQSAEDAAINAATTKAVALAFGGRQL